MWRKEGTVWIWERMDIITIEPADGPDGESVWQTCCGGRPVPQIHPCDNIGVLIMETEQYYRERIEATTVKEPWR